MMIFVDTNVFIRAIVQPSTPEYERMARGARHLFEQAATGEIELTTSEAHIAEAAFVLTSKRNYGLPVEQTAGILSAFILETNMRIHNRAILLDALEFWSSRPSIGLHDAIAVIHGRLADTMLATFDHVVQRVSGVNLWRFGGEE